MKHLNFFKVVPNAMKNLIAMEKYFNSITNIDKLTIELIKIRASQINGCAFCLNMHTIDTLKLGETNQRIFLLNAWQETDLFSEKEKVTLELTERLALASEHFVDEDLYNRLANFYDDVDFSNLVLMIAQINTWNRINIATNSDIDNDYK